MKSGKIAGADSRALVYILGVSPIKIAHWKTEIRAFCFSRSASFLIKCASL